MAWLSRRSSAARFSPPAPSALFLFAFLATEFLRGRATPSADLSLTQLTMSAYYALVVAGASAAVRGYAGQIFAGARPVFSRSALYASSMHFTSKSDLLLDLALDRLRLLPSSSPPWSRPMIGMPVLRLQGATTRAMATVCIRDHQSRRSPVGTEGPGRGADGLSGVSPLAILPPGLVSEWGGQGRCARLNFHHRLGRPRPRPPRPRFQPPRVNVRGQGPARPARRPGGGRRRRWVLTARLQAEGLRDGGGPRCGGCGGPATRYDGSIGTGRGELS